MANNAKFDGKNPDGAKKPSHGLRVPLPAALLGLGMLASTAQQAEAATAVNDNYAVQTGSILSGVNILSNDSYGNVFSVVAGSASFGTAVVDGVGNLTYTPNPGFSGSDSFSYELSDIFSNSVAQVNILVSPVPTPVPTPVPALESAALVGLSGLLAAFGLRRRRD